MLAVLVLWTNKRASDSIIQPINQSAPSSAAQSTNQQPVTIKSDRNSPKFVIMSADKIVKQQIGMRIPAYYRLHLHDTLPAW